MMRLEVPTGAGSRAWPVVLGTGTLLLLCALELEAVPTPSEGGGFMWITFAILALASGVGGLILAGRDWTGIARVLRMLVIAGLLMDLGLGVKDFLKGASGGIRVLSKDGGYAAGYEFGRAMRKAEQHQAWRPKGPTPWSDFVSWALFSGAGAAMLLRLERHRREAERQRRLAAEARDAALRAKLAPHFIFNTLNTLHAQIEADPRGAQATTERLAQLFRQVVDIADEPTIPLKQELAFVEAYLGIEQARMGARLGTRIDVPEELETCPVPPLSLQVLVENAIKHGVAPREQGGEVRVAARRQGADLRLSVWDPGRGEGAAKGTGTALETLRARLRDPAHLRMGRIDDGFEVSFTWRGPRGPEWEG